MFEIDKHKFGAFVAELRKENGYTQKELASRLFISDKAVSKWETGMSIPDTTLLIPLSEALHVSVTELLMCQRMESDVPLQTDKVEDLVKTAITYTDETVPRAYQMKSHWTPAYLLSLIIGSICLFFSCTKGFYIETLVTIFILSAVFGAYFCFFVKMKLPAYYDENNISVFNDCGFQMSMPGVRFTNRNWRHIVTALRAQSCLSLVFFPALALVSGTLQLPYMTVFVFLLVLYLGSLFLPIYVVGNKYN